MKILAPATAGSRPAYALDVSRVDYLASARVEFGKQNGKPLPGRIHLCVPGNQKGMFNAVHKDPIEVVRSFVATLE